MARIILAITFLVLSAAAWAEDIHGTVIIKHRLTRKRVTAAPTLYQRGPAVELRSDRQDDPLAVERARVVVYIEGQFFPAPMTTASLATPSITATMEQKDRRFIPELLAVPAGSTVSFPNLDPIFHNVFSLSKGKSFDLGNYSRNQTRLVTFIKPGIEFINCHLHPNMSAAIVVTPNKWCAVADRNGQFNLRDVPAGPYTLVAWHKAAGCIKQTVNVVPNRGASVEFLVPLDTDGVERGAADFDPGPIRIEAKR
jgi:plastocyanin